MEVPVRLTWLPGQAVSLPQTFPTPVDGKSCELVIGPIIQNGASGLRLTCNARTCEVLAADTSSTPAYECTLRGTQDSSAGEDMFVLVYKPQGGLRSGCTIYIRLLSLKDKLNISLASISLFTDAPINSDSTANGAPPPPLRPAPLELSSSSASSQMAGIREMLAQMAGPSSEGDSSSDPKRALMAAIARSALEKGKSNKGGAGTSTSGGYFPRMNGQGNQQDQNTSALLSQVLSIVRQQQEEIAQLRAAVVRLEGVCGETLKLLQSQNQGEKGPS